MKNKGQLEDYKRVSTYEDGVWVFFRIFTQIASWWFQGVTVEVRTRTSVLIE